MDVNKLIEDRKALDDHLTSTVDARLLAQAYEAKIVSLKATIAKRAAEYLDGDPYYFFENCDTYFMHAARVKVYGYLVKALTWSADNAGKESGRIEGFTAKERVSREDVSHMFLAEFRYHNPLGSSTSSSHNLMAGCVAKVLHDALFSGFGDERYMWREAQYADPLIEEVRKRQAAIREAERAAKEAIEAQQKREERNKKSRESKARNRR